MVPDVNIIKLFTFIPVTPDRSPGAFVQSKYFGGTTISFDLEKGSIRGAYRESYVIIGSRETM